MLLVLSSLWGAAGGIPAFNRLLVRAAAEFAQERGHTLKVIALTDADDAPVPEQWLQQLPAAAAPGFYQRCAGVRSRCASAVLRELPRQRLVVFGHVNLAPLGLGFLRYGVVAHGTEVWTRLPALRRLALRRATAVGCVSDHTAAQVHTVQGVAATRCARLCNALPALPALPTLPTLPAELLAPPASEQGRPVRILSVTRLHPAEPKGIDLVLRALVGLPGVEYTVVGGGDALPSLRRLATELGVAERVRFAGPLSDFERDVELRRCDVFALPSSGEGFGIVYLEAMAYGKPCLAAQAGGAPEVVLDGQTGLVVAPSGQAVQGALQRLVDSAQLREQLGRAGRERVASCFGYAQFRAAAFEFFSRLEE